MWWLVPKKETKPGDISLSDLPGIFDKLFNMKAVEIWNTNVSNFPLLFQILQSFPHLNPSFLISFRSTGESFQVFWWQKFWKISFVSCRHSISRSSSRIFPPLCYEQQIENTILRWVPIQMQNSWFLFPLIPSKREKTTYHFCSERLPLA